SRYGPEPRSRPRLDVTPGLFEAGRGVLEPGPVIDRVLAHRSPSGVRVEVPLFLAPVHQKPFKRDEILSGEEVDVSLRAHGRKVVFPVLVFKEKAVPDRVLLDPRLRGKRFPEGIVFPPVPYGLRRGRAIPELLIKFDI